MAAIGMCEIGRVMSRCRAATVVVLLLVSISAAPLATAQVKGGPQKTFPTPEAAADALAAAYQQGDSRAVANLLGDKALRLVFSGDAVIHRRSVNGSSLSTKRGTRSSPTATARRC